jgi:hypothetical protein
METRKKRVQKFGRSVSIDCATRQDERGFQRVINGKKFDIDAPRTEDKILSSRDKRFYAQVQELLLNGEDSIMEFVVYLLEAKVLLPIGAYGEVAYFPKGVRRDYKGYKNILNYHTNHGTQAIIYGIIFGLWDPSDVVCDLLVLLKDFHQPGYEKLREKAKTLLRNGYSVRVLKKKYN